MAEDIRLHECQECLSTSVPLVSQIAPMHDHKKLVVAQCVYFAFGVTFLFISSRTIDF